MRDPGKRLIPLQYHIIIGGHDEKTNLLISALWVSMAVAQLPIGVFAAKVDDAPDGIVCEENGNIRLGYIVAGWHS